MATAQDIIAKARSYVGTKESPANSNNVIFNTDYYGKPVSGDNYPWCAAFCWDIFRMCNASGLYYGGKKTALCAEAGNWYKKQKQWYSTPAEGDLVFFKFNRTKNWTNHIGIVSKVNSDGTFMSIEGNTSLGNQSNGGEVMERKRTMENVVGFGRPAYTAATPEYPCRAIDVAGYNLISDYKKLKAAGVQKAIIKIIRKDLQKDKLFETHYEGFTKAGIPVVCVYNYSYATTIDEAKLDAKKVIQYLNGRKVAVCMDVEDACQKNLGVKLIDIINAYQNVVESSGLIFVLYTGLSFWNTYIQPYVHKLHCKNVWIARYYNGYNEMTIHEKLNDNYKPNIPNLIGWQYTSSCRIDGAVGKVDADIIYSTFNTSQSSENTTVPIFSGKTGTVTAPNMLNVRYLPVNGQVVKMLKNGTKVNIYGQDPNTKWYCIGNNEWVSNKYITLN